MGGESAEVNVSTDRKTVFCAENPAEPCGIVVFGASGDLAHRKIIPALFNLFRRDLLPDQFYFLGFARTSSSDEEFRNKVRAAFKKADAISGEVQRQGQSLPRKIGNRDLEKFIARCYYLTGAYDELESYADLGRRLRELDEKYTTGKNHIFYMSVPPGLDGEIVTHLGRGGFTCAPDRGKHWARVVLEKPIGRDLKSALALDTKLHQVLTERQIYRIDHYLGKETVQNILMFRFANAVFEPIWNRRYIDHVQITVAESIGVGHRSGYFEHNGLLRDMFQNHMLLMLALVAMEPPVSFDADRVRDEKVKLLRSVKPWPIDELGQYLVRGQYQQGEVDGDKVCGYREEEGVADDSQTETYVAGHVRIDNWRWQGVPFYLRSGKRLPHKVSEIAITFRGVPHSIFSPLPPEHLEPNTLVLNVQPQEGVALTIQAKTPGAHLCMGTLKMDFKYRDVFGGSPPEAYERLLLDCMLGDQTLFIRNDYIEVSWSLLTPILEAWQSGESGTPPAGYAAGSWGPKEADDLIGRGGRQWRKP